MPGRLLQFSEIWKWVSHYVGSTKTVSYQPCFTAGSRELAYVTRASSMSDRKVNTSYFNIMILDEAHNKDATQQAWLAPAQPDHNSGKWDHLLSYPWALCSPTSEEKLRGFTEEKIKWFSVVSNIW